MDCIDCIWQVYFGGGIILVVAVAATYIYAYNQGWKNRGQAFMRIESLRQEKYKG